MIIPILVTVAAVGAVVGYSTKQPCTGEGCDTYELYLGPRWGSKVISDPFFNKIRNEHKTTPRPEVWSYGGFLKSKIRIDPDEEVIPQVKVEQRPIYEDDKYVVDFGPRGTGRPSIGKTVPPNSYRQWGSYNPMSILDLSTFGYTGAEVKTHLHSMSEDSRQQLRSLRLGHNAISELPTLVFPVELEYNLQELLLNDNPLSSLYFNSRFELTRLAHLRNLSLARTGLTYLEVPYVHSLEVLDLSGNRLYSLPSGLESLKFLKELYLYGNSIYRLSADSFNGLTNLRVLDLSSNRLSSVWGEPLQPLRSLNTLYLNNNSLQAIPQLSNSFSYYIEVRKLYLSDNPWTCTCSFVRAISEARQTVADINSVTCNDGIHNEFKRQAKYLSEEDLRCFSPTPAPGKKWTRVVYDGVEGVGYWLHYHTPSWITIFTLIGWTWFAVVFYHRAKKHQESKKKIPPTDVPYNILDDSQTV